MRRYAWVLGLLALGLAGCGDDGPLTQVVVIVDADAMVRADADGLRIEVFGGPAGTATPGEEARTLDFAVGPGATGWPRTVGLAPKDGDATRLFRVVATARDGETTVVARTVVSGYVAGDTRVLRILLEAACIDVSCAAAQTCSQGTCIDAFIDPETLPPWGMDAGPEHADGGMDAGRVDSGLRCARDGDCDDGVSCTLDVCESGTCVQTPFHGACDDDIDCTRDVCEVGLGCTSTPDCDDGFDCTNDVCDALGTGDCVHVASDAACMDGIDCTSDSCSLTEGCVNTPTAACDDGIACTGDMCGPTGCTSVPSDAACDDGVACTVDVCEATGCAHLPDATLCNDTIACTVDTCAGPSGCLNTPEDSFCNDGVACTVDTCSRVGCTSAPDDARCTASAGGMCHPTMGCQYPTCNATTCRADPDICETATCMGSTCVRRSTCMVGQVCCAGACVAPGCNDGDPCTDDTCTASGCRNPIVAGRSCNDGNACTSGDTCRASGSPTCRGTAITCSDGNVCTTDSCNPASGCVFSNNTAPCSDGNMCTVGDACMDGTCRSGTARMCNDMNVCTNDSCNPATGCVYTNNMNSCSTGNMCTKEDYCMGGMCRPGSSVACSDPWLCTTDTCNPATGCVFTPNHALCDDCNACTTDRCLAGSDGGMFGDLGGCSHTAVPLCDAEITGPRDAACLPTVDAGTS